MSPNQKRPLSYKKSRDPRWWKSIDIEDVPAIVQVSFSCGIFKHVELDGSSMMVRALVIKSLRFSARFQYFAQRLVGKDSLLHLNFWQSLSLFAMLTIASSLRPKLTRTPYPFGHWSRLFSMEHLLSLKMLGMIIFLGCVYWSKQDRFISFLFLTSGK